MDTGWERNKRSRRRNDCRPTGARRRTTNECFRRGNTTRTTATVESRIPLLAINGNPKTVNGPTLTLFKSPDDVHRTRSDGFTRNETTNRNAVLRNRGGTRKTPNRRTRATNAQRKMRRRTRPALTPLTGSVQNNTETKNELSQCRRDEN